MSNPICIGCNLGIILKPSYQLWNGKNWIPICSACRNKYKKHIFTFGNTRIRTTWNVDFTRPEVTLIFDHG